MVAPLRPWADLEAGVVSLIADFCTLKDYASCRAVCGPWRSALPPPLSRPLAVLPADDAAGHPVSLAACSLHAHRWSRLFGLRQPTRLSASGCRCVGARDGWVVLVAGEAEACTGAGPLLFNPFTGVEIPLDESLYEPRQELAPKIVFSPNPTPGDFAAVSICRPNRLAVQRACDHGSFFMDTGGLMDGAVLVDVAYGDDDKVYCLAMDGEVHVLHLNRRRRHRRRPGTPWMAPVEVGTLLSVPLGADAFPPPYDAISRFTDYKNLFFHDGVLYQMWRRPRGAGSATVDAPPGGARRWIHIFEGDVFVLKYDPESWPCWTVAEGNDLVGSAVFVGMNDATVVRGKGVRANSVYYWDGAHGVGHEAVVYNMVTGASVRWPTAATGNVSSPAWYFLPAGERRGEEAEATNLESASDEEPSLEQRDDEVLTTYKSDRSRFKKPTKSLGRLGHGSLVEV